MLKEVLIADAVNVVYPLREASSYPESPFMDMVLRVVKSSDGAPRSLRLWLKTKADSPRIDINRHFFEPKGRSRDGGWLDFGVVVEDAEVLGVPGFGIIRFYGMDAEDVRDSYCVITSQTDLELTGDIAECERLLQGVARSELGCTSLSPCSAVVGQGRSFVMRYASGGIPRGSIIRLTFPMAFALPQNDDPDCDGWLSCNREDIVSLVSIDKAFDSHEKIDVFYRVEADLEPGAEVAFEYRTDFVYIFPSRWSAMERRYWWAHMPPMAMAVAVDDRRIYVPIAEENGHALTVEAGPVDRLFLFLPGRLKAGEKIRLNGLFTDKFRNIPSYSNIPWDMRLVIEGAEMHELGSPAENLTHWHRFQIELPDLEPGVYRVKAIDGSSGHVIAESNPLNIIPHDSKEQNIYWGEIHAHSEMSDGSGDYREMFVHARECGSLDFAAAADHACYHSDNEWLWMQDVVNSRNEDGRFVTLVGYEWAGNQGHRNSYTSRNRLKLFRGMSPSTKVLKTVYDYYDGDEDVVSGPHVNHTKEFYDCHNPNVQRFLEIYSMWGNFEELGYDILSKGAKIGFTGGGDCHEAHCGFSTEDEQGQGKTPHTFSPGIKHRCGMTAAMMESLDRRSLISALRNRRTYATSGARILLDFSIGDLKMGCIGKLKSAVMANIKVSACAPIESIDLIQDGHIFQSWRSPERDCGLTCEIEPENKGWYVCRVKQSDGQMAWSSPIWIHGDLAI